jgi:hypothetical protein
MRGGLLQEDPYVVAGVCLCLISPYTLYAMSVVVPNMRLGIAVRIAGAAVSQSQSCHHPAGPCAVLLTCRSLSTAQPARLQCTAHMGVQVLTAGAAGGSV